MFDIRDYCEADSILEALTLLNDEPDRVIIAGGTDILVKLQKGQLKEAKLLGLNRISELKRIETLPDGTLAIGTLATFSDLAQDPLIENKVPILKEAALAVGGPQIRNVATIGGNLCNGATSADSAPSLFALNARLVLRNCRGERVEPIANFYLGPGKVDLQPGEILTHILLDAKDFTGFTGKMLKFATRKAMDIATLGLAVMSKTKAGKFETLRIALGVASPTPLRCQEAESFAQGKPLTAETIDAIARLVVHSMAARTSWRASREYREHLAIELTRSTLMQIMAETGGNTDV